MKNTKEYVDKETAKGRLLANRLEACLEDLAAMATTGRDDDIAEGEPFGYAMHELVYRMAMAFLGNPGVAKAAIAMGSQAAEQREHARMSHLLKSEWTATVGRYATIKIQPDGTYEGVVHHNNTGG